MSVDMRQAFDTISHTAVFEALRRCDVPEAYVVLVMILYANQTANVYDSKFFKISRGVKQGDVLSAIFFNCVLDIVFDSWKSKLRYEGIMIEDTNCHLTNSRYADDILLYARYGT